MNACQDDHTLFYQLVRRQRQDGLDGCATIDFKLDPSNSNTQTDNWATYFHHLATPATLPQFDEEYRRHIEIKHLLLQLLTPTSQFVTVDDSRITKHIRGLKNNKAPDPYGVQAEHVKYAHESVYPIITGTINRILSTQVIPDTLKLGTITPVIKKKKPKHDPDSFRRITVNPVIGKILEEELVPHTNHAVKPNSSRNQFGFKEGVSCNNAGVLITEAMMEAKDAKSAVYVAYMDTSKAFDMVHHGGLMCALHNQGVHGALWKLYNSAYSNIRSQVKWQGELSDEIEEGQGIRQGAKTSTGAFNCKADPMLHKLCVHPDGYRIGTVNIGAVMVADDLALASRTQHGLQSLIHIAEHDAATQRYVFSDSKTKILTTNVADPPTGKILLNGKPVGISKEEVHLGIIRRADLSSKPTIEARIKTARRTVYALAGAGLYGLNGVSPETCMKLIDIYVLPRLTYGLECLTLSSKDTEPLDVYYRDLLRQVQHLPPTTANPAVYMLVGALPIEAHIHQKTLCMFGSIMRREDSLEYQLMERQLGIKENSSHSWAVHARKLLIKYDLPRPAELLYSMKGKQEWKRCVKVHIQKYWYEYLKEAAKCKSTLEYLNTDICHPGVVHPVWSTCNSDPLTIHRAVIHAHLLTQRYPINTSHTSKRKSSPCPSCKTEEETLEHFILKCKGLAHIRTQYLPYIIIQMQQNNINSSAEKLLQVILDPSKVSSDADFITAITSAARTLCFHLHKKRLTFSDATRAKTLSTTALKRRNILSYREPTVTEAPGAPK